MSGRCGFWRGSFGREGNAEFWRSSYACVSGGGSNRFAQGLRWALLTGKEPFGVRCDKWASLRILQRGAQAAEGALF
jgi:hypothetical protein